MGCSQCCSNPTSRFPLQVSVDHPPLSSFSHRLQFAIGEYLDNIIFLGHAAVPPPPHPFQFGVPCRPAPPSCLLLPPPPRATAVSGAHFTALAHYVSQPTSHSTFSDAQSGFSSPLHLRFDFARPSLPAACILPPAFRLHCLCCDAYSHYLSFHRIYPSSYSRCTRRSSLRTFHENESFLRTGHC
jgi:hypothetical protein